MEDKKQISRYREIVRFIIKKMTGSDNEDLEQEIYIKAWQNREKYHDEGKPEAWLKTLAANVVRDYFKSKVFNNDKKTCVDSEKLDTYGVSCRVEEKIDAKKRQKIILKAVDSLPSKLKKVVILYEFEEKSYTQIAEQMNLPVGTVKSRLSAARKELYEKLKFLKGDYNE